MLAGQEKAMLKYEKLEHTSVAEALVTAQNSVMSSLWLLFSAIVAMFSCTSYGCTDLMACMLYS